VQRLLNTKENLVLPPNSLQKEVWDIVSQDSIAFKNPLLAFQKQQVEIADRTVKVERAKAGPDFTIGYFNQSLIGIQSVGGQERYFGAGDRFQGVQAGVALPLFFKPFSYRVKAAKIEKQVAEKELQLFETNLQGQYRQAYQDLLKNSRSIAYYENSAIPNANLILKQAQLASQNGEIGYIEYLQALRTYSDIRFNYLQAINDYNQSIYSLQYIIGL